MINNALFFLLHKYFWAKWKVCNVRYTTGFAVVWLEENDRRNDLFYTCIIGDVNKNIQSSAVWHIHTIEYYTVVKLNAAPWSNITWMDMGEWWGGKHRRL